MRRLISSLFLIFLVATARAQEGSPLLTHFSQNRDIENQNWSICQDTDRIMVFANRKGLLSFDGQEWIPSRIQITPYTLRMNPYNKVIYVGGENNYGFIYKDEKGLYRYKSLSGDSAQTGMITRITFNDSLVLFIGDNSVSSYNFEKKSLSQQFVADDGYPFTGSFLKGGNIFINVAGRGLYRIDSDTLFPIVTGYITANTEILFSLPYDRNRIILGFNNGKLSLFDGIKYYNYPVKDDGYIIENILAEGITAGDSLYVFSTLNGGAVVVEKYTGNVRYTINNQNGLPDDEIFAMGSDDSGGLWLSHYFGLTRADLELPVRNFGIYPGLTGNLAASLSYNNHLYVATTEGIFYLADEKNYTEIEVLRRGLSESTATVQEPPKEITAPLIPPLKQENTRKGLFTRIFGRKEMVDVKTRGNSSLPVQSNSKQIVIRDIPAEIYGTEKIKKLKSIDYVYRKISGVNEKCRQLVPSENGILAATNRGLYVIRNHTALLLVPDRYINFITWQPVDGAYAVGASDGYFMVKYLNSKWSVSYPDRSFRDQVYSITMTGNNILWIGGDNKAFRVEQASGKVSYKSYEVENSFSQRYFIDNINDSIFLFTESSINVYDQKSDSFVAHSETGEYKYPVTNFPLAFSQEKWIYPQSGNQIETRDLSVLKLFDDVASVYYDDGKMWVIDGTDNLFSINCREVPYKNLPDDLIVKKVSDEKGTIFNISNIVFERGYNTINFDVVVPSYLNRDIIEYQYYIDKVMTEWSPWSTRASYSRGVPRPGTYELLIRARDMWGQEGEPVRMKFTIKAPYTRTTIFYVTIILSFLAVFFSIIRFREQQLQETNRKLEEKVSERTAEIEAQKEEITSSITYASRLQMAMLPVSHIFADSFSDYFIIFKPRDIVSGDFYWIGEDTNNVYFTVADCTGHGVPGAFMSTLGVSILNEIMTHNKDLKANELLNLLREKIKLLLHQTGKAGEAADGMDISLCVMNKDRRHLQFAGAFNPLFINTGGEIREIKADRMPIGIHYGDEASFSNHEIRIKKGDVLYLLSDGLTDQFGGPDGSRYKKVRLIRLLSRINEYPLSDQKKMIELEFLKWKSSNEQVDDVTVLGVRI